MADVPAEPEHFPLDTWDSHGPICCSWKRRVVYIEVLREDVPAMGPSCLAMYALMQSAWSKQVHRSSFG